MRFEGPVGSFFLREDGDKPIIFVAGATGFAPVKSMVEHAFHAGMKRPMVLYWGMRRLRDLYLASCRGSGRASTRTSLRAGALRARARGPAGAAAPASCTRRSSPTIPDLAGHQIYACGSVKMVEAAQPAFAAHGLVRDDCFSDAFKLAPRIAAKGAEIVRLGGAA